MERDQHFMIDKDLIKRIVDALELKKRDKVIEIGGGRGALTQELYKKCNLSVIEISEELSNGLKKSFPDIKVINENALNVNLDCDKLVGNLPYSICEAFMKKLVKTKFKKGVFTVPASFLAGGILSDIMKVFFTINTLEIVENGSFEPKPRVKSKVIRVIPKRIRYKGQLVREIYLQSDKVLRNAIREGYCKVYGCTKREGLRNVPELNFLNKKVYTLNSLEWKELLNSLDVRQ